ncbi:hypothetical protein [Streptomyces poonensis]|uniref:Uncharacterized protein n=1 Tax=Streptomyces poonensis TaxID=68255 RepID=A0A918PHH2_9ACTN|nr:hypothetical protein [Streptomyces poonensis]GGZ10083.1 hypothetical protein GCM10010365_31600 [Streptomyces poonensis]GLJ91323.1 hypothetical protein GCM10017589_39300 [Streptomyces poonensis]
MRIDADQVRQAVQEASDDRLFPMPTPPRRVDAQAGQKDQEALTAKEMVDKTQQVKSAAEQANG